MTDRIPATPKALDEAVALAAEILVDIELSRIAPALAALKASRLARLLNDVEAQEIFRYESSGYPSTPTGIPVAAWQLIERAGRTFQTKDSKSGDIKTYGYTESLDVLAESIHTGKLALAAAEDRDVAISSANPLQTVFPPPGNWMERMRLQGEITTATARIANRRSFIYDYAASRYYELKFSGVAQDVFAEIREDVDAKLGRMVPAALQQFSAVHDNLRSENPEDWANAAHSCRRVLQGIADVLFPPTEETRTKKTDAGELNIRLGKEQYINRLVCYAEDHASSKRFRELVGSHLALLGDRLDAVFRATQKGSHGVISKEEAHRYVVYTYMIIGDLLSLADGPDAHGPS